jgi:very-short-patch-repair endonuclease
MDLTEFSKVTGRLRKVPEGLIVRARELRERQTPSEKILWECLRDRRLLDAKFRRQHNVGPYIADFYCHTARLVVELDGGIHLTQQVEDENRNEWMRSQGITVLRFPNEAVQENIEGVLEAIGSAL